MIYETARQLADLINPICGREAVDAALRATSQKLPSADAPATVFCKAKQRGVPMDVEIDDRCFLLSGGSCPKGITQAQLPMSKIIPLIRS